MIRAPLSGLQWGDTLECLPPSAGEGQTDRLPSEGLQTRRQRHGDGQQPPPALAHGRGEQGGPAVVSAPVGTEARAALRAPRGSAGVLALVKPFSPLPAMRASRRGSARPGWGGSDGTLGPRNGQRAFRKAHLPGAAAGAGGYHWPQGLWTHRKGDFMAPTPSPESQPRCPAPSGNCLCNSSHASPYAFLL